MGDFSRSQLSSTLTTQEYKITHTVMHRLRRAPIEYIPAYAARETWIAAYTHNFSSIGLADVALVYSRGRGLGAENNSSDSYSGLSDPPLSHDEPPLTRGPRERPSDKMERNGNGTRNLRNLRKWLVGAQALPDIPDRAVHAAHLVRIWVTMHITVLFNAPVKSGWRMAILCRRIL